MSVGTTAYLVVRRTDGFGDVFPLAAGQSYLLGRAATNRIVLKDDLCSREHAEVRFADGAWRVRDLGSLNGTRVNEERLDSEQTLEPGDEVQLGRSRLLFVEEMGQLPDLPNRPEADGVAIKKRLGQTRFLTPVPPPAPEPVARSGDRAPTGAEERPPAAKETVTSEEGTTMHFVPRHSLSRDLSLLYRLALDMGSATNYDDLCRIVLDALLEAIPAEVGAILFFPGSDGEGPRALEAGKSLRGTEMEVVAHRHRDPSVHTYKRVSDYVSNEVLATREAILAEDVARDRYLRNRESLSDLGATSLICAPVLFGDRT